MVIMVTTYSLTVHHLNKQKVRAIKPKDFQTISIYLTLMHSSKHHCPGWQCGRAGQAPRGHLRPGGGHGRYIYSYNIYNLQHIYNLSIFIYTQVGATAYPGVGLGVPGMAQHIATTTQHQRYGYLTASKHFYQSKVE